MQLVETHEPELQKRSQDKYVDVDVDVGVVVGVVVVVVVFIVVVSFHDCTKLCLFFCCSKQRSVRDQLLDEQNQAFQESLARDRERERKEQVISKFRQFKLNEG